MYPIGEDILCPECRQGLLRGLAKRGREMESLECPHCSAEYAAEYVRYPSLSIITPYVRLTQNPFP